MQLVGTTALFMASKMEEVQFTPCKRFSESTLNKFSVHDITQMEQQMAKAFAWHLTPTTLYFWLNSLCEQWDQFIVDRSPTDVAVKRFKFLDNDKGQSGPLHKDSHPFACFGQRVENNFRKATQALDLCTLDLDYAKFEKVRLSIAMIVISLLIAYDVL